MNLLTNCRVTSLLTRASGIPGVPQVTGIRTHEGEDQLADVVIDAGGRRSQTAQWLEAAGARPLFQESLDCGLVYYSRHFRCRRDTLPPITSPIIGNTGFLAFAVFPGDGDTFGIILAAATWDTELRALREDAKFLTAAASIPALSSLVDPEKSMPITSVIPFGQLRNMVRRFVVDGTPVALGLHCIGDTILQTNPAYGWGMSLGMSHAAHLAEVLQEYPMNPLDQAIALDQKTFEEAYGRYQTSVQLDDMRDRRWRGEIVDPTNSVAEPAAFVADIVAYASSVDPQVYHAFVRDKSLLDPPGAILRNTEVLERARSIFAQRDQGNLPKPSGPTRDQLLESILAAQSI